MDYLIAFLAFSAVMIVLATLATVIVQAFQKLLGTRASNFNEMLTKLYAGVIAPKLKQSADEVAGDIAANADQFVLAITRNPAIQKIGVLRRIPLIKKRFKTKYASDFEELTTRQFIEQFRDTPAAQKIKKAADKEVQKAIEHITYEFERYGQAASMYFKRRATLFAILASLLLAFALNVDAIKIYQELAKDKTLSEKVVAGINVDQLQQAYEERIKRSDDERAKIEFEQIKNEISNETARLEELGLPFGRAYFPYCQKKPKNKDYVDARCEGYTHSTYFDYPAKAGTVVSNLQDFLNGVITVFNHSEGYVWFLRTFLSGLLIGLGAPFWFKTYQFLAQFVPARQAPAADSLSSRQNAGQASSNQQPIQIVIKSESASPSVNAAMLDAGDAKSGAEEPESKRAREATEAEMKSGAQKSAANVEAITKSGLTGEDVLSIFKSDGSVEY